MTDRARAIVAAVTMLTFTASAAAGEVYRWVDASGKVTYSDRPPPPGVTLTPLPGAAPVPTAAVPPPEPEPTAPGPTAGPVTMDDLMEVTGLDRQFRPLAALLVGQFQIGQTQLGPADRQVALRALTAVLDPDRLRQAARTELARAADRARMEAVAAWHRGPLGARKAAVSATLETPAGQQQFADFTAHLQGHPPSPARLELVERADWIDGSTDANVVIMLAAARSMRHTLNALLPADRRQRPGAIERQLEEARRALEGPVHAQVLVSLLFTYRGFTDAEVEQSIAFTASDASRWFDDAVRRALVRLVTGAVERATRELIRAVPLERWQGASPAAAKR